MSYRRNGPSRNILLHTAAEVFSGLGAASAAALLLAGIGCTGCSREGAPAQAAGAATAHLRFDPEKADHSDLAVFETVVERIALRSDAPVDWPKVMVESSCECLSARFVDTSDPKRAVVELTFNSDKLEDIDGIVRARLVKPREEIEKSGLGELLAEYTAKVVTRRIPFVVPRSIVLEKGGSGRFDVIVGQAFALDAKPPETIFKNVHYDEDRLSLVDCPDFQPLTTETQRLLRTTVTLELVESARASPFKTKVKLEFGVPSVEKSVDVEWK